MAYGGDPWKWESPDQSAQPDSAVIMELRQQVQQLTEVVTSQMELLGRLSENAVSNSHPNTTVTPRSPTFVVKPRDIPELKLHELEGLGAGSKLAMFIDRVEQVTSDDGSRLQVAKTRLGNEIALLIQNFQLKGECRTWVELKEVLRREFASEISMDQAWQELEEMQYHWDMGPHLFSHTVRCKFAVLETNFPRETLPNRDQTIKRKICQGLPVRTRQKLVAFLDTTYPLKKFLERVEYERQFLLARTSEDVFNLKENIPPKEEVSNARSQSENPMQREIQDLASKVDQLVRDRQNRWCSRCRKTSHNTQDCWGPPRKID